jgi:hypothetical protein
MLFRRVKFDSDLQASKANGIVWDYMEQKNDYGSEKGIKWVSRK